MIWQSSVTRNCHVVYPFALANDQKEELYMRVYEARCKKGSYQSNPSPTERFEIFNHLSSSFTHWKSKHLGDLIIACHSKVPGFQFLPNLPPRYHFSRKLTFFKDYPHRIAKKSKQLWDLTTPCHPNQPCFDNSLICPITHIQLLHIFAAYSRTKEFQSD